jgi:plasmid stabilization system protein ParE
MKFTVRATDAAILDEIEAACWYELQEEGLGRAFEADVSAVSRRLEDEALHHRMRFRDVRRAPLRRFSDYGLFYVVRGTEVIIFAIVHGARNPAWVRRKRNHLR